MASNLMQNDEIKKNHKKIKEKISESTRVNLTNPPPMTWSREKK